MRALILAMGALLLIGCGDKTISLSYRSPAPREALGPTVTILSFADHRGNEGDHGDPYRVGGIYGGYGNRLAKVMATRAWPPQLLEALVAEFRAQGVDAVGRDQLPPIPDPKTPWLEGDVRNFSTESRWGREAHIAVIVRLRAPDGRTLVDKRIEVRESGYHWNNFNKAILEELLNRAFAEFVRRVATDPEITAALQRLERRP